MKQTVEEGIFEATRVRLASRIRYRNLQHGAAQRVQNQDAPQPDLFLKSVRCFRNIDSMIGLIMLFCSSIEIPWPGRKQKEPINKGSITTQVA